MDVGQERPPAARRRARRLRVTGIAAVTLLVTQCAPPRCAPPPAPAAAPAPTLSPALQQVVDLTNRHRAEHGLAPVTVDGRLVASARRMSHDMAAHDTILPGPGAHLGSDGSDPGQRIATAGYAWRSWAENIASGYTDASSVVAGWWKSAGHRANMLDPAVTQIGLAVAWSATGVAYWTQDYGRPR